MVMMIAKNDLHLLYYILIFNCFIIEWLYVNLNLNIVHLLCKIQ